MKEKIAEKTSLEIVRFINAPTDRVYDAWTDPAQLRQWFGPEGEEMSAFGEYRELVPGKKIVFTWQWDDDEDWENWTSVVTIQLFERGGGTELRFRHEQLPSEESRDRHNEGWNSFLNRLEQFISK